MNLVVKEIFSITVSSDGKVLLHCLKGYHGPHACDIIKVSIVVPVLMSILTSQAPAHHFKSPDEFFFFIEPLYNTSMWPVTIYLNLLIKITDFYFCKQNIFVFEFQYSNDCVIISSLYHTHPKMITVKSCDDAQNAISQSKGNNSDEYIRYVIQCR